MSKNPFEHVILKTEIMFRNFGILGFYTEAHTKKLIWEWGFFLTIHEIDKFHKKEIVRGLLNLKI